MQSKLDQWAGYGLTDTNAIRAGEYVFMERDGYTHIYWHANGVYTHIRTIEGMLA